MYPEEMVAPMRRDLTQVGFEELRTPEDVSGVLGSDKGTVLMMVNSVCGCSAGNARPAVKLAINHAKRPARLTTVFAGVDTAATDKARQYMTPFPPSSPSIALFKGGKVVHFIQREQIQGHPAELIADNLIAAFDEYC